MMQLHLLSNVHSIRLALRAGHLPFWNGHFIIMDLFYPQ